MLQANTNLPISTNRVGTVASGPTRPSLIKPARLNSAQEAQLANALQQAATTANDAANAKKAAATARSAVAAKRKAQLAFQQARVMMHDESVIMWARWQRLHGRQWQNGPANSHGLPQPSAEMLREADIKHREAVQAQEQAQSALTLAEDHLRQMSQQLADAAIRRKELEHDAKASATEAGNACWAIGKLLHQESRWSALHGRELVTLSKWILGEQNGKKAELVATLTAHYTTRAAFAATGAVPF